MHIQHNRFPAQEARNQNDLRFINNRCATKIFRCPHSHCIVFLRPHTPEKTVTNGTKGTHHMRHSKGRKIKTYLRRLFPQKIKPYHFLIPQTSLIAQIKGRSAGEKEDQNGAMDGNPNLVCKVRAC